MRVPDSLFQAKTLAALRDSRNEYLKAQEQVVTGRRANRPSDDPIAMARVKTFQDRSRRSDDHERAISVATSRLQVVDSAMAEIETTMASARQIAVQAGNDSLNAGDRAALGDEVDQLLNHLGALADTRQAGKYVFSGIAHDTPPMGGATGFQGSTTVQEVEVAPGVRVPLGISGFDLFDAAGRNIDGVLLSLRDSLNNNDRAALRTVLGRLVSAGDFVSDQRAEVGAYQTSVDIASSVVSRNSLVAEENIQREVGADVFEAFSAFSQAQTALASAVEIASQLPLPGLASR